VKLQNLGFDVDAFAAENFIHAGGACGKNRFASNAVFKNLGKRTV
jgi:hypothetical protein